MWSTRSTNNVQFVVAFVGIPVLYNSDSLHIAIFVSEKRTKRDTHDTPTTSISVSLSAHSFPIPAPTTTKRTKNIAHNGLTIRPAERTTDKHLHFQNAVALFDARLFGGPIVQTGRDMLQRCVQLAVDGPQLAALGYLAAHIEAKARFRFVNGHDPRPARSNRRHLCAMALCRGHRRLMRIGFGLLR